MEHLVSVIERLDGEIFKSKTRNEVFPLVQSTDETLQI